MIALLAMLTNAAIAATYTVNTNTDSTSSGTLRWAITQANLSGSGNDTIQFTTGLSAITLDSGLGPLPAITASNLEIDGNHRVIVSGSALSSGSGLSVIGAADVEIYGMVLRDFPEFGIAVRGSTQVRIGDDGNDDNALTGNALAGISVGPDGATPSDAVRLKKNRVGLRRNDTADGNCVDEAVDCAGIEIEAGSGGVEVLFNYISANHGHGVRVHEDEALIDSNVIGTDSGGEAAQGNAGDGILVSGTSGNLAEDVSITNNIIVANGDCGVRLAAYSADALVFDNRVGVGADDTDSGLGNTTSGIRVVASAGHVIGGATDGNVIGGNGGSGVSIRDQVDGQWPANITVNANYIGLGGDGEYSKPNAGYGIWARGRLGGHTLGAAGVGNVVANNDLGGIYAVVDDVLNGRDDWASVDPHMACASDKDWSDERGSLSPAALVRRGELGAIEVDFDIAPSCATNDVPLTDIALIQVVLLGEAGWSVNDLPQKSVRFMGAAARAVAIEDVNTDSIDDLRAWFLPTDTFLDTAAETALFNATLTDGRLLWGRQPVLAAAGADTDGDGIIDGCDACSGTPLYTAVGDDGCP